MLRQALMFGAFGLAVLLLYRRPDEFGLAAPDFLPDEGGGGENFSEPAPVSLEESLPEQPAPIELRFAPRRGPEAPQHIADAIYQAAQRVGVDYNFLYRTAQIESGFDPGAGSDTGARGLFQFIGSTWRSFTEKYGAPFGITPATPRDDVFANALMGAFHAKEAGELFERWYGRPPTDGERYAIHFLGPEAKKVFDADGFAPMDQVLPRVWASSPTNRAALSERGQPLAVSAFLAKMESYFRR